MQSMSIVYMLMPLDERGIGQEGRQTSGRWIRCSTTIKDMAWMLLILELLPSALNLALKPAVSMS